MIMVMRRPAQDPEGRASAERGEFARITQDVYDRIDNAIYDAQSDAWWQPDSPFYQMRVAFNPARVGYARRILFDVLRIDPQGKRVMEVGSGGGFICEEMARLGFETTGIDPSEKSVAVAASHAARSGLAIRYDRGRGESLPYADGAFDIVLACDVLEHVRDLPSVISEAARVLRPGGVFCYDTFNRTFLSWLAVIKVSQEWNRWAFLPPRLHVWRMFIKPREMKSLLVLNHLDWREHRGLVPNIPVPRVLARLRERARGELSYADLSRLIRLRESRWTGGMYIGYALKTI